MSFVRRGKDSDVYVFGSHELCCQVCILHADADSFFTPLYSVMLAHLDEHRAAGHDVPDRAYENLREGQAEDGNDYVAGYVAALAAHEAKYDEAGRPRV